MNSKQWYLQNLPCRILQPLDLTNSIKTQISVVILTFSGFQEDAVEVPGS